MAKTCIKCNNLKEISEFPKRCNSKDGTRNECKICYNLRVNNWAKDNEFKHQKKYYDLYGRYKIKHKRKIMTAEQRSEKLIKNRLYRYKITKDYYEELLKSQNNKCSICGEKFNKTPCIDHNHNTGKVRKLLCCRCNFVLGLVNEDINILNNSINYLEEHELL